jgi:predicted amidophosphoribosyltransferase
MDTCKRCGRKTSNGSDMCYKCNKEFQKYMKEHPLKWLDVPYSTIFKFSKEERKKFLENAKAEDDERYRKFMTTFKFR